jgi:Cdc6-like AAA superfamily ATPase
VDLTGYSPHDEPPWTDAKGTMVEQSQCREVQSIVAAMKNGEAPFAGALTTRLLVQNFLHSQTGKTYTTEEAGKHLSKSSPERVVEIKTMRIGGKATVVYCWKDTKYWADPKRTDDERRKAIG